MKPLHVNSQILYERCLREATIKVAVDAGANVGGYTNTLLEHGFSVHAFEPVPSVFKDLQLRFGSTPRVKLNQLGLSDSAYAMTDVTVLEAWTIGKPGDGGLQVKPEMKDSPVFDIHTISLDSYLGHKRIGIFKLDVDGMEPRVLRGAAGTLIRDHPPILCEFSCYINKLGHSPEGFINLILSLGYHIWSCDGENKFSSWQEIAPHWPYHSSFDVMLLPFK